MYDFFLGKYGLDWAAAIFMFLSIYRLGKDKPDGFLHAALACGFWIAFNVVVESAAGIVANGIILALSVQNFSRAMKGKKEPAGTEPAGPE